MRNILILILCLFLSGLNDVRAQQPADGKIQVYNLDVARNDGRLYISMDIDRSALKLRYDREVVLTPMLMAVSDSIELSEVYVAGRNRYYRHLRGDMRKEDSPELYRSGRSGIIHYQTSVAFEDWMREAELVIRDSRCGCLSRVMQEDEHFLMALDFVPKKFAPTFLYVQPVPEVKHRALSGTAFVDFRTNLVEIDPSYRNNAEELKRITATIDSVKNDPDARITFISIKGFASPEGPYANNEKLAKGRTAALVEYVRDRYSLPADFIKTDYEPEDWDGLRKYVENWDISSKEAILEIIDGDLAPDPKEWRLKSTYREEYRYLLENCYPALRHSDYLVEYQVRSYTDVEEAKRVMKSRPGNLSPHEFYRVANTYEEGSEEFTETFDTMVRIFPEDEIANLNAANAAMSRSDLRSARKFLQKAGRSAKADYARGVLEALEMNYPAAAEYFEMARVSGIEEAVAALEQLEDFMNEK